MTIVVIYLDDYVSISTNLNANVFRAQLSIGLSHRLSMRMHLHHLRFFSHHTYRMDHIIRKKHFTMITTAWILWVCIILHNLVELLFRTNIIVPVDRSTCLWYGRATYFLLSKIGLLIELVFMEPIMEIFKLSGSLKCSQNNFQICRIFLVILTILCDVTMVYYGEFYHTNLTHHRSFYVCQQNNLMANWQTGVPIVASMFALIVICIVF
eukprot:199379_1